MHYTEYLTALKGLQKALYPILLWKQIVSITSQLEMSQQQIIAGDWEFQADE